MDEGIQRMKKKKKKKKRVDTMRINGNRPIYSSHNIYDHYCCQRSPSTDRR